MSDAKITDIVNNLLDGIHGVSRSETIIGEAQQAGDATVIPVHRLKLAFGAASGQAGAHGSKVGGDSGVDGAGGAIELDPVAAIAVGKDGHAHVLTVDADSSNTWARLLDEVPDLLARLANTLGERVDKELRTRGVKREALDEGAATDKPQALPSKSAKKDDD
jgi:uncharacterized spore protein YtfJ